MGGGRKPQITRPVDIRGCLNIHAYFTILIFRRFYVQPVTEVKVGRYKCLVMSGDKSSLLEHKEELAVEVVKVSL